MTTEPAGVYRGPAKLPSTGRTVCCGDPTNRDGGAHPWVLVDDSKGDLYRCPECGTEDID